MDKESSSSSPTDDFPLCDITCYLYGIILTKMQNHSALNIVINRVNFRNDEKMSRRGLRTRARLIRTWSAQLICHSQRFKLLQHTHIQTSYQRAWRTSRD